jgi:hypothetical protein
MSLGGSNTYNGAYSALLDHFFKEFISADSYCMNEGLLGMGPLEAADKEYHFLSWPTSNWPNLISLEFAINCRAEYDCAKDIHDLMFHLINVYNKRGTHALIHSLTHYLIHSLTHSLIYSLTHSLTSFFLRRRDSTTIYLL